MPNEHDLEILLAHHPYLISETLNGQIPQRQLKRGRNRLDLAFELAQGLCIVELKKTGLTVDDLRQLLRYCRSWARSRTHTLAEVHYLVGKRPREEKKLWQVAARSKYKVEILYLDEHVPTRLVWDDEKRRYRPQGTIPAPVDYLSLHF